MSSVCKSSPMGCVDDEAQVPVRATYNNLYRQPESDAEFVKSVVRERKDYADDMKMQRKWAHRPALVDSYSCRRMFLRSYTFSREESFSQRTKKRFIWLKKRPSFLACLYRRNKSKIGDIGEKKRNNTKARSVVKELREVYYAAFQSIYHRLLACTATVDVIDQHLED